MAATTLPDFGSEVTALLTYLENRNLSLAEACAVLECALYGLYGQTDEDTAEKFRAMIGAFHADAPRPQVH
jgi:hypothetical protein